MKSGRTLFRWCILLAASLLIFHFDFAANAKPIRLRNELIETESPTNQSPAVAPQASAAPMSGLYLIQFIDRPQPAWREQLKSLGVDLLRYVPEDAFVAHFENAQPAQVRALSFIRWVGPYRPEHKMQPRLASTARDALKTNGPVTVNILLSPNASEKEISEVRGMLSTVHHESRLHQGTILRAVIHPKKLDALVQSGAVLWIENASKRKLVDEAASKIVGGDDGLLGTPTLTQQLGYNGAGVTVAVADTGLDNGTTNNMHPDLAGRVSSFIYYSPLTNGADEHSHGTHVAGIIAGNAATGEKDDSGGLYGLGVASGANLVVERIFDGDGNEVDPPPSDETLTRNATRAGAKIGSNSWGNDVQGGYDLDAATFDELVRDADTATPGDQPYILEFSAGNAGPDSQTLDSPASGKNVIATGASENGGELDFGLYDDGFDTMADFSSRGPCEDGRIKPDVVAPGTFIASLLSASASDALAWLPIDNYYIYMGGTSQAGPHASGAAAVFVQYYKAFHTNIVPSPALVKAALINSAEAMDINNGGPGPIPNNDEGWGRLNLANIIGSPLSYEYVDQTALLSTGQFSDHHTFVQSSSMPLKITLAYTDVAGFPGALPALVNDLDLEVTAPDGTLYRGNQFDDGESVPNPPVADNINNVEGVYISQPIPGDYLVRVRARNVVQDARLDTQAIDQDFALVISGNFPIRNTGIILMDRTNYTAPGVIKLEVLDAARAASNTVTVTLKSTTESAGETYVLHAAGAYGAFTNQITTVLGNAAADSKLEIHNGDLITATYLDASGTNRTALATADLSAPIISSVAAIVDLGVITITWQTSELANSVVRYSTNFAFNLAVTNLTLTTAHSVKLGNLIPGKTYYFTVGSTDLAGNAATNNNGGANFSFIAVQTPTVLFVNAYETADGSAVISDATYTNALAATGFGFATWKVVDRGSPQLSDLQPFKAVVWRVTDDEINYDGTNNTLSPQQQFMIQNYLNGGGSFFMASMGILSQLGAVSFRQNILQVAQFIGNSDPPFPCSTCDEDFGVPAVLGATGDTITSGMSMTLDYSQYPTFDLGFSDVDTTLGPDFSSTFTPGTNATPIFFESVSGKPCGMRFPRTGQDSPGRVVFLSFPLDSVPETGAAPNNETILLINALKFLVPGANGVGSVSLDASAYTIPDQVTVEVGDLDLAGQGKTQVSFFTSSGSDFVTINLNETPHLGLFRGFITLVATNVTPATNQIRVHNHDTLFAAYFDQSTNSYIFATAVIDLTPPVITNVSATTSFENATITWTTSKPADSTAQAGTSFLLDHSGSSSFLVTNHAVTISGLSANTKYYFQVASRDNAGNTTVNDNNGNFFTFQTRAAPQVPWFDNLENGVSTWKVVPDPNFPTEYNWTLGKPNNGLQSSAHSGTNAWGSDLLGQTPSFGISTYLYSPFIDLSGLSRATLTFWDSYDFSDVSEEGQIMISTNSSIAAGSLPVIADFSGSASPAWEQETIDLTPYVGHTVQIVWDYVGVSFGSSIHGWLVDDIAITGTSVGSGGLATIVISKNIGQGTYTLSGPINKSGTDLLTTISNAPLGQYTVQFSDVAFYQTPADQSGTPTASGTLILSGNYTFDDVNHNGISDAWEQFYFGNVSTNRTQLTDTDHDGMSDYAEFIAGTNPTNATSKLVFLPPARLTNGVFKLQWPAIPGRLYQVEIATNLNNWQPATDWVSATGSPMTYNTTNGNNRAPRFFRIQVRP